MTADDVKRLCREASLFATAAGLELKARPIVIFEFANIAEFAQARSDLMAAIKLQDLDGGGGPRTVAGHMIEIDCQGVVFRLVCHQRLMMRRGPHDKGQPYGAAEIDLPTKPLD